MDLCEMGCGRAANFRATIGPHAGKLSCCASPSQCPAARKAAKAEARESAFRAAEPFKGSPCAHGCGRAGHYFSAKGETPQTSWRCAPSTNQCPAVMERARLTMIERYGVAQAMHHPELVARCVKSCGGKLSSPEVDAKRQATCMARYGVTNPAKTSAAKRKAKATTVERYGTSNIWSVPEILAKREATCQERYGTRHPMQSPDVFHRAQVSMGGYATVTTPGGRTIRLHGYEDMALMQLLGEGVRESDILFGTDVPRLPYVLFDIDTKKFTNHFYYPDFFIPSKKLLVEVKSTWTYEGPAKSGHPLGVGNHTFEKNMAKFLGALMAGFSLRFMVMRDNEQFWESLPQIEVFPQGHPVLDPETGCGSYCTETLAEPWLLQELRARRHR